MKVNGWKTLVCEDLIIPHWKPQHVLLGLHFLTLFPWCQSSFFILHIEHDFLIGVFCQVTQSSEKESFHISLKEQIFINILIGECFTFCNISIKYNLTSNQMFYTDSHGGIGVGGHIRTIPTNREQGQDHRFSSL